MHKSQLKTFLLTMLVFVFAFSNFQVSFAAESKSFSDASGHWAEKQLLDWSQKGWINGYPDGTMRPDSPVTRTEYMALMNKALGFKAQTDISFKDLKSTDWQYPIIQIAVKAGYVKGYANGTIHPDDHVSRQEAAVMLAAPLNIVPEAAANLNGFKDASTIAKWSYDAIAVLVNKKVISGYADRSFGPAKAITRAEAVVMINRALKVRTTLFGAAGSFGPETGLETISGNVTIQVTGVTLRNMIIEGDLLFAASLGSGDALLKNVTVRGNTVVNGGGSSSIHLEDSTLGTMTINKTDGDVRIVAEGGTTVNEVNVESGAKLEQDNVTNGGFS